MATQYFYQSLRPSELRMADSSIFRSARLNTRIVTERPLRADHVEGNPKLSTGKSAPRCRVIDPKDHLAKGCVGVQPHESELASSE